MHQSLSWPIFPYGGDYNPEQWPREIWDEDMRLMRLAHWNVVTLPVFGWVSLEPEEGSFRFDWLDELMELLHRSDIRVCMATATASVPAWLTRKYPDVLVVNEHNQRKRHGHRHTFCPNSPNYRRLSCRLAEQLATRYGSHPALLLWHVNNEYCTYCYCDQCAAAFRVWLRGRYGDLDTLNERWVTRFWGHTYTDWEQIEPPMMLGESSIQAQTLDYRRFQSESLLNCYRAEADVLRRITPDVPITTNMMGPFFPLDYYEWAKHVDVVAWDNYPRYNANPSDVAFAHCLMRGLKGGQPFLLMEQSPSQQNWAPYNRLKPPGQLRLQSYQAIAHGADSIMYFQWRRSRGGIEKLHGAVVEPGGDERNRVFQEVAQLGAELQRVGPSLQGARVEARVAVLFDWPNWWGLAASSGPSTELDYLKVVRAWYGALHTLGIPAEVISPAQDVSRYDVIVAPLLTMVRPDDGARIAERVSQGATLVATAFTGLTDENDRVHPNGPPGPWREALGIFMLEADALPPELPSGVRWSDGETFAGTLLAERVRLEGAQAVATYTTDFYAGEPAVTRNVYGRGEAWYCATYLEAPGVRRLLADVRRAAGVEPLLPEIPSGVEVAERISASGERHLYLLNHGSSDRLVSAPGMHEDLLTGDAFQDEVPIAAMGVRILRPRERA